MSVCGRFLCVRSFEFDLFVIFRFQSLAMAFSHAILNRLRAGQDHARFLDRPTSADAHLSLHRTSWRRCAVHQEREPVSQPHPGRNNLRGGYRSLDSCQSFTYLMTQDGCKIELFKNMFASKASATLDGIEEHHPWLVCTLKCAGLAKRTRTSTERA